MSSNDGANYATGIGNEVVVDSNSFRNNPTLPSSTINRRKDEDATMATQNQFQLQNNDNSINSIHKNGKRKLFITFKSFITSCDMDSIVGFIKSFFSIALLTFSVGIVLALIANRQTNLSSSVSPAFAFIVLFVAMGLLTMIEGSHVSVVGLTTVNNEMYKDTHPKTYRCTSITNSNNNLHRYLVGRQLLEALVVFCVNLAACPIKEANLWNFPILVKDLFVTTGIALILITCMLGQLNAQINASHYMLDYINNYFALFIIWLSLAIEFSGLLHASYAIQYLVRFCARKPVKFWEDHPTFRQAAFFLLRCKISFTALGLSFTVIIVALSEHRTTLWDSISPSIAFAIFLLLMCVIGILEGIQIAFFYVSKLPASERGQSANAIKTCNLLFGEEGHNNLLASFMIGHQLCVVTCMLFVARVTSIDVGRDEENMFGVPDIVQDLFNTDLLGALILTIVGSISWQLAATEFPTAFLSSPFTYGLLRWCLFLESTGICQGAWVLAGIQRDIAGFQLDEAYIGTADDRTKEGIINEAFKKGRLDNSMTNEKHLKWSIFRRKKVVLTVIVILVTLIFTLNYYTWFFYNSSIEINVGA